ncbi:MAG: CapA family protein [bacterium]
MKINGRILIFLLAFCAVVTAVFLFAGRIKAQTPLDLPAAPPPQPVVVVPPVKTATVLFAGDILMHKSLNDAAVDKDGNYDYAPLFIDVTPFIKSADYAIGNLETTLSGEKAGYTGYPCFNTPDILAKVLSDTGFDMLATANNHCLDRGVDGLKRTQYVIEQAGMDHTGTNRSKKESDAIIVKQINGIKIAILNYTAMTNGGMVAKKYKYTVNYIGDGAEIIKKAQKTKKSGTDFVIAYLHFGNEYERNPTNDEKVLVNKLLAGGVDAVIGAHPHVVQPIEWVTVKRDKDDYTGLVAWSLGNFVSAQRPRYRDSGIAVNLKIEKSETATTIKEVKYLPVWVQHDKSTDPAKYRLLPLPANSTLKTDTGLTEADLTRIEEIKEELSSQVDKPNENIIVVSAEKE